jgi:hypothetical protein
MTLRNNQNLPYCKNVKSEKIFLGFINLLKIELTFIDIDSAIFFAFLLLNPC